MWYVILNDGEVGPVHGGNGTLLFDSKGLEMITNMAFCTTNDDFSLKCRLFYNCDIDDFDENFFYVGFIPPANVSEENNMIIVYDENILFWYDLEEEPIDTGEHIPLAEWFTLELIYKKIGESGSKHVIKLNDEVIMDEDSLLGGEDNNYLFFNVNSDDAIPIGMDYVRFIGKRTSAAPEDHYIS